MIREIDENFKQIDAIKRYKDTHKFISGETYAVRNKLKALGGIFYRLHTCCDRSGRISRNYNDRTPIYSYEVSGYFVPNDKAEEADAIVVKGD